MIIRREITDTLLDLAKQYPVVTITGPRQSGKTTLVKNVFPNYKYFSLESPDVRERAFADPRGFLNGSVNKIILDEIQKAPQLLSYIQELVDADNNPGKFILTGSQNIVLMKSISQSLAGRTALLNLLPLNIAELKELNKNFDVNQYLFYGFFPRIHDRGLNPTKVYSDYYDTYIQKDLRELIDVRNILLFQKFVHLCAGRVGQIFKASEISNELGVSVPTINSWLAILQESYIIFLLEPYYVNISKRIIKSPKLYFYDPGLATYLLRIEDITQLDRDPLRGPLFENMVILEFIKFRYNQGLHHNLYFYHDKRAVEVDILYTYGQKIIPVEIKSSQTFIDDFLKGARYIKNIFPNKISQLVVVYSGKEEQRGDKFSLLNYKNAVEIFNYK